MLTLQFVPYGEIESLTSDKKIKKLLDLVKENKIILLEGRLKKTEEVDLIKETMTEIDEKFKGIEVSVLYPGKRSSEIMSQIKANLANILLGDRQGLTVIGPASLIKEIKKEGIDKIQLMTEESHKEMLSHKESNGNNHGNNHGRGNTNSKKEVLEESSLGADAEAEEQTYLVNKRGRRWSKTLSKKSRKPLQ